MSERAAYSRVYWSVLNDPKFRGIRSDMRHFGSWAMLLIVADMAWPAPAFVPSVVSKRSLAALVEAGLVDLEDDGMFRIHGLDSEREHRRALATTRGPSGHRPGDRPVTVRSSHGYLDETRRDEERSNETLTGRERAGERLVGHLEKTA